MSNPLLDGLALVDPIGRTILATTAATLALAVTASLAARARYQDLAADLSENAASTPRFLHAVLNDIARSAQAAARRSPEPNTQGIVEEHFHSDLKGLLLAERFVRAATGLVIILGLLGTFYGLTSSIGKLIHLVAGDPAVLSDATQGVTVGLTQALSGMAVAFSNSLFGIGSAVVLTVLGVFTSLSDRREALMVAIEAYLDGLLSTPPGAGLTHAGSEGGSSGLGRTLETFAESVERLEAVVARFDAALQSFSTSTRDFTEFNAHLKDNVQRMSLSFGDLSDTLKHQVVVLKRGNGQ